MSQTATTPGNTVSYADNRKMRATGRMAYEQIVLQVKKLASALARHTGQEESEAIRDERELEENVRKQLRAHEVGEMLPRYGTELFCYCFLLNIYLEFPVSPDTTYTPAAPHYSVEVAFMTAGYRGPHVYRDSIRSIFNETVNI